MNRDAEAKLAQLKAARELHVDSIREIDRKIGRVASKAIAGPDSSTPAPTGIPIFENLLAAQYVLDRGIGISRSISAYSSGDVLARSNLDPRLFVREGQKQPSVPKMLWQLENGEWVGIDQVSVGYGGNGCRWARKALVKSGIAEETAARIVSWRFCDAVDINDHSTWEESRIWPVEPRSIPNLLEDRIIVHIGERFDGLRDFPEKGYPFRSRWLTGAPWGCHRLNVESPGL